MSLWRHEDRPNVCLMMTMLVSAAVYYFFMGLYALHCDLMLNDEKDLSTEYQSHPRSLPGKHVYWALFGPPIMWFVVPVLAVFSSADRSFVCMRLMTLLACFNAFTVLIVTMFVFRYIAKTSRFWNGFVPFQVGAFCLALLIIIVSSAALIITTHRRGRQLQEDGYDSDCSRASVFSGKYGVVDEGTRPVKRRMMMTSSDEESGDEERPMLSESKPSKRVHSPVRSPVYAETVTPRSTARNPKIVE